MTFAREAESGLPCEPIQFGPEHSSIFGFYHPPAGPSRSAGVVLCNPIGDDDIRAHRPLRRVALDLARAGFAVLRFDFRGTGDSPETMRDPARVATWLEDVRLAVAELRARSSATQIALLGIRLGGALAATAAATTPGISSLVLWNAYPSGTAFVTESTKLHRMHMMLEPQGFASVPKGWDAGGKEALGFVLTPETVSGLSAIDLFAMSERPAPRVLFVGTANVAAEEKLVAHLRALGSDVDYKHFPGQKFLVLPPHRAELPLDSIAAITDWFDKTHTAALGADGTGRPKASASARGQGFRYGEEPFIFGREHPLFGIIVHAKGGGPGKRRPAIIMTNAGSTHRVGPHRIYVELSRAWAELGFTTLRMDLAGIGDSPTADGCEENREYPRDAMSDLSSAMRATEAKTGAKRFIILGLCSGGDLAFKLGFHGDPRVAGVFMLNPRTLCMNDLANVEHHKRAEYYIRALAKQASWKKALRGEVYFGRAIGLVVPYAVDMAKKRAKALLGRRDDVAADGPTAENVPPMLRKLAERGVDTLLVASEKDPGVDYVDSNAGRAMAALASVPNFRRADFMGTDHTFTSLYSQGALKQLLTDHLLRYHA